MSDAISSPMGQDAIAQMQAEMQAMMDAAQAAADAGFDASLVPAEEADDPAILAMPGDDAAKVRAPSALHRPPASLLPFSMSCAAALLWF
jgi:hypothetical protein